ncbi:prolyl oligopeptidase family serine peptidase, partial [Parabacteroides distasonis]|nr:prolyl oligopeptidase family serine peptidase [Parabacteroides distasonis]
YKKNKVVADYALKNNWANYDFCPATNNLAFTEGNNVHILSPDGRNTIVTRETQDGIVCGQAVHQREFGITKGMFWSPKGSALAFYRMDERMVTAYPLVNIDTRCATPVPHKYPMAGMKSHEVTVGVYQVATGQTVWLETGLPKEKYLTNIAWSPDEKSIYIAELNREQNEMHLMRYSALTGKKEADLFTETDRCYVEPQHPVLFLPNDPDKFIWQSEADGYNHLYLYDTTGKELRKLTGGEWVVTKVLGFSKDGNKVIFEGTAPHPVSPNMQGTGMQRYIWETDLRTGDIMNCLSWKVGVHRWLLSPSGEYAIDYVSSPSTPRDIDLVRIKDAKVISTLLSAPDPFKSYRMPRIKVGHILAADGKTRLNYRLTLPPDLDETKKYPTIVYVYGGPKVQLVTGDWQNGARGWDLYMAQRGYVMFTVDSRGSANRGHAFESVIHRNLGINEMADQVKGVEFLKSLSYVDADRIGVHGWSYGGFMTTNLMLTYPEIFKVGVAGGPVIDWSNYEIMYGERYMDRPQDNPEGYKNANLKLKAGNLKGHLLMIHGDIDPVVVWQHSLGFLKACVEADTYPDYFVYPRHEHNVTGKDRPHLHEKITRYFDDYLGN